MQITDTLSPQAFEQALRDKGAYYHIHHPYHIAMHNGQATREQIQGWVANRFYYQTTIPLKDAAIMANCPDPATRRKWVQRILDHDGSNGEEGGIEAWLRLGEAVGLTREELLSEQHVLPGVRFAVDAYINFARRANWQEAACSSSPSYSPRRSTSHGSTAGRSTIRGSKKRAISTSAVAWVRRTAMWNMAWRWRWNISPPLRRRTACWKFCSLSSIFYGACWMP